MQHTRDLPADTPDQLPARRPGRVAAWLAFVVALTSLNYAGRFSDAEVPDDIAYRYWSSIAAAVQFALILGVALLIARGAPFRQAFALVRPASWPRALGLAGIALLLIYLISFVYVRVLALFTDADPSDEQGLVPTEWDPDRAGAFAAFFVAVVFVGPFVEEVTYRGIGFRLLAPYGKWLAILVTGILFGAAHGLLVGLPVLAAFGIVVGWLRARTGSTYPTILVHSVFNGVALIAALFVST